MSELTIAELLRVARTGSPSTSYVNLRTAARTLDIAPRTLSDYENGRAVPDADEALRILALYALMHCKWPDGDG